LLRTPGGKGKLFGTRGDSLVAGKIKLTSLTPRDVHLGGGGKREKRGILEGELDKQLFNNTILRHGSATGNKLKMDCGQVRERSPMPGRLRKNSCGGEKALQWWRNGWWENLKSKGKLLHYGNLCTVNGVTLRKPSRANGGKYGRPPHAVAGFGAAIPSGCARLRVGAAQRINSQWVKTSGGGELGGPDCAIR